MTEILRQNGLNIHGSCSIDNFYFEKPFDLWGGSELMGVIGGGYTSINGKSRLEKVKIGRYCCVAHNVMLGVASHDKNSVMMAYLENFDGFSQKGLDESLKSPWRKPDITTQTTNIGHGVWIGAGVCALSSKELFIGNGAIIGSCAVVTKDIPAYAIAVGNPARVIKMRFSDEICADLDASKWWEYDWMEAAKAKRELASIAPLNNAKAFCTWWSDGGKELLAPFKLDGKISLITKENGEMVLKKTTNSFDELGFD